MPFDPRKITGRNLHWFQSVDSTMYEAVRLAAAGCPTGTVVGADKQTAGHGRFGRRWHSEQDAGLYFSIVLRLPVAAAEIPVITLALGVATAAAIEDECGVRCDLRWPNDVLIGERKCGGILTELHGDAVVAGIGINVNHRSLPEQLEPIATSIRMASGREHSHEALLARILDAIDIETERWEREGKGAIIERFRRASSYVFGRAVVVEQTGGAISGVTDGLDDSGFLYVRRADGERQLILAGGVRPCC